MSRRIHAILTVVGGGITSSSSLFGIMGRGMLVFKGDAPKKKKKKSKTKHTVTKDGEQQSTTASLPQSPQLPQSSATVVATATVSSRVEVPALSVGSGKITTSGAVVTGLGTRFERELSPGDAMVVRVGGREEMRVVKMRLSNTSCGISSAFSVNLASPTPYSVIRKPRDQQREARKKQEDSILSKQEAEAQAQGTFAGNNTLTYRERTEHGSYRIRKVGMDQSVSRGELLRMRAKKTSDKYC